MQSHPLISSNQSPFDVIYILAKAQDEVALNEFIQSNAVAIDVRVSLFTPIGLLAAEGDHKAVRFLLEKFGASLNWAVRGYAAGGHVEQFNQLIAEATDQDKASYRAWALQGYALGGHVEQVKQLIAEATDQDKLDYRGWAVQSYAHRGDVEQVKQLIIEDQYNEVIYQKMALVGYGEGGHVEQVNQLIAEAPDQYQVFYRKFAVWGYARGGHVEPVKQLIIEAPEQDKAIYRKWAVQKYAIAGHVEQVKELILEAPEQDKAIYRKWAVQKYAIAGHVEQVKELILEFGEEYRKWAVVGYAKEGHVEQVNQSIAEASYLEKATYRKMAVVGYEAYKALNNKNTIISLLANTDDSELRKALIDKVIEKKYFPSDFSKTLQLKMEKANRYIKTKNFNYKQAYAVANLHAIDALALHIWVLQGEQLVKKEKLLPEIYLLVTAKMAAISVEEAKHLCEKIRFNLPKMALVDDLNKLANRWSFFSSKVEAEVGKAKKLLPICESAKTKEALRTVLNNQRTEDKAFYQDNIARHHKRLLR